MAETHIPDSGWTEIPLPREMKLTSVVSYATAKRMAKIRPVPSSIRMAKWPNALGNEPSDAIGKTVRLARDGGPVALFVIARLEGDKLMLEPA